MRSSTGAHYIALDHVRALAGFMVFVWHFTHASNGYPVPFDYVPALFPFSVFDEGHTGVALFMTLSGYLFAKLLDGRSIHYGVFIWNRIVRLLPLLAAVIAIVGIENLLKGVSLSHYVRFILKGALFPSLPNGGWAVTVEFHYYLILPVLLWLMRKSRLWPLLLVLVAIVARSFLFGMNGEIQSLAYWTIVGRIDQFALGMLAYRSRAFVAGRHALAIPALVAFLVFYWYFDLQGGFFQDPPHPSRSPLWILVPAVEGLAYALGIAWYDNSFSHSTSGISRLIGRIGEYSYSIYLLHYFVVFSAARFVNERIMDISSFYAAFLWSIPFFVLMVIPGYVSFRYVEAPFLRLRKRYIRGPD
jgi:peptidoglycan/LPS O-acetylase OafA/YrhL